MLIDLLRQFADKYRDQQIYYSMISSIMYAMSYCTQSTGHFAQYRDGNTIEAMNNIIIYRIKNLLELFLKKLQQLVLTLGTAYLIG